MRRAAFGQVRHFAVDGRNCPEGDATIPMKNFSDMTREELIAHSTRSQGD